MRRLCLALFASTGVFAQVAPKPGCALNGSVLNAITGQPLPRTGVLLIDNNHRVTTVTNNSGKWEFSNIGCAGVRVNADRRGFVQGSWTGVPAHDVEIRLMPSSAISGKVVDDQGEPAANSEVYALVSQVVDGRRRLDPGASPLTHTNDLGEYRLAGLAAGKYVVCARANGALPLPSGATTLYADRCGEDPIQLAPGRDATVDFTLMQVPAVHVRGVVSGLPDGAGAGVTLTRPGSNLNFSADRAGIARPDGVFDIASVAPGTYILRSGITREGRHLTGYLPITVGPDGADGIALRLEPDITLTGAITVADPATPVPAKQAVRLMLRSPAPLILSRTVESKDNLTLKLDDVAPGEYRLIPLFVPAPFYIKSAAMGGQDMLNGEFTVSQGAGPIRIVLADDGGSIEGDVVNADGQPASGGVMAIRNGRAVMMSSTGRFKLQNLAPGDYKVYAWDDPFQVPYADDDWMKRYAGSGTDVTVASGQSVQVKLTLQTVPR